MNAKERKKLVRAVAHRKSQARDALLEKNIVLALTGCSARVYKAINTTPKRKL